MQQSDIPTREGFESKLTFGTPGIRGNLVLVRLSSTTLPYQKLALGLSRYLNAQNK